MSKYIRSIGLAFVNIKLSFHCLLEVFSVRLRYERCVLSNLFEGSRLITADTEFLKKGL